MKNKRSTVQLKITEKMLDWKHFVTLPQMRTFFPIERLRELAYNITLQGLINPQIVIILHEQEFWKYVDYVCTIWKRPITEDEITALKRFKHGNQYHVIVAGERRLRAFGILWNEGCPECQKSNGGKVVGKGRCWRKHFGHTLIKVRVPKTKDFHELVAMQLSENIHDRPHAHEEAEAIAKFAIFLKSENEKMTYAKIAKRMGRSPEMVSRSISFYGLPQSIRVLVHGGIIKYGIAIELARLKDKAQFKEEELLREANIAVTHRQYAKVEVFRTYVTGLLMEHERTKNKQVLEFAMVFAVASPEQRMRSALDVHAILAARTLLSFLGKSVALWEHPENAPFVEGKKLSLGGLLDDYQKVINMLEVIIPYVESAVSVTEASHMRAGVKKISQILERKKQLREAS